MKAATLKQDRPLSYSALKAFSESPNHLVSYWNRERESTPAMIKGSLIHTLILEPEKFESSYAIWKGGRRAGGEYTTFCELNASKEIIKPEDLDEVTPIAELARKNILIKNLKGTELLIEWDFAGVPFKGFVDGYGDGFILDIKTTSDASPKAFLRDFVKYKYYWQAALYLHANRALNLAGDLPDFFIVAVETNAPFNVQVYKVAPEFIDKGFTEVAKYVQAFKDWNGEPGGYEFFNPLAESGVLTLNLPEWL